MGAKALLKAYLPTPLLRPAQRLARRWRHRQRPVPWRHLRRLRPVSDDFFQRGRPLDRYYIEKFLQKHADDIRGVVLEVADAEYTRRFGADRVTRSEVLHAVPGNPQATIVGDLSTGENIPAAAFDCIIFTQTLHVVYDIHAVVRNLHAALRPGGVVLVTAPGISQIVRWDYDRWGDHWRFTSLSAPRLFSEAFDPDHVHVETYGNVLAAVGFLHRLAVNDLRRDELDYHDPDYELILGVRAQKPPVA